MNLYIVADDELTPIPQHQIGFVVEMIKFIDKYKISDQFWVWKSENDEIEFHINTNDVFAWGCADSCEVKEGDIPEMERAIKEAGDDGLMLFAARKEGMRPQGAMYAYLNEKYWPLFDACGPYRTPGFGDPIDRDKVHEYIEQKRKRRHERE